MDILLTNDDGIYSQGLYAIYKSLRGIANIHVVAPEAEQSAVAHAITMSDPLRVKRIKLKDGCFGYAVSGTPADCVKIAVRSILRKRPDLVVSGINLGPNTGFSVLYSGTVSGATEGAILGIPSFAVSLGTFENPDFRFAAVFARKLANVISGKRLPRGTFLNVNVPACHSSQIRGIKFTEQGLTPILERYDRRVDPRKHVYYWLTGEVIKLQGALNSDIMALKKRYISITPLHCDMTDHRFLDPLKKWSI
ncbi:MAG: 5'/3'-nucleotidase SurE [Candidatus Omnitrophica bacterium]|nr:5'/3'-nucleotidase SurE [Candidatus Omnitrophota bacterium]